MTVHPRTMNDGKANKEQQPSTASSTGTATATRNPAIVINDNELVVEPFLQSHSHSQLNLQQQQQPFAKLSVGEDNRNRMKLGSHVGVAVPSDGGDLMQPFNWDEEGDDAPAEEEAVVHRRSADGFCFGCVGAVPRWLYRVSMRLLGRQWHRFV